MINPHQFHWKLGGIFLTQLKVFKKKVTVIFFISFLFQKKKKKKEKTVNGAAISSNYLILMSMHSVATSLRDEA